MDVTTLMIVDRRPVLCDWLSGRLAEVPDFRVVATANSAGSLTEMVDERHPSVVLIDEQIVQSAGPQLVGRVHASDSCPAVVLLASAEDPEDAAEAVREGASAFVLKQAPLQDLVAAIRWAQRGEVWMSTSLLSRMLVDSERNDERPETPGWSSLTGREREVLALLVDGLSQKAIARRLSIAVNTVRTHSRNVQVKLHVRSNLAAVSLAMAHGMRPHPIEASATSRG